MERRSWVHYTMPCHAALILFKHLHTWQTLQIPCSFALEEAFPDQVELGIWSTKYYPNPDILGTPEVSCTVPVSIS